jgi:hypothetical protein
MQLEEEWGTEGETQGRRRSVLFIQRGGQRIGGSGYGGTTTRRELGRGPVRRAGGKSPRPAGAAGRWRRHAARACARSDRGERG